MIGRHVRATHIWGARFPPGGDQRPVSRAVGLATGDSYDEMIRIGRRTYVTAPDYLSYQVRTCDSRR